MSDSPDPFAPYASRFLLLAQPQLCPDGAHELARAIAEKVPPKKVAAALRHLMRVFDYWPEGKRPWEQGIQLKPRRFFEVPCDEDWARVRETLNQNLVGNFDVDREAWLLEEGLLPADHKPSWHMSKEEFEAADTLRKMACRSRWEAWRKEQTAGAPGATTKPPNRQLVKLGDV